MRILIKSDIAAINSELVFTTQFHNILKAENREEFKGYYTPQDG